MVKRFLPLVFCLGLASNYAHAELITKSFDSGDIKQLDLRNANGNLKVTATSNPKLTVSANKRSSSKNCIFIAEKSGSTLKVEVKAESSFRDANCDFDIEVQTPREVAIAITNGSGSVQVRGTKGIITYTTGSGNVDLEAEITTLDGKSGSGSARIFGLTGSAELKAGSGNIEILYSKKPERGILEMKTGSGNMTVYLPVESKMKTLFIAGSGQLSNEIGDTPGASFTISAKAGSGNLAIKKS